MGIQAKKGLPFMDEYKATNQLVTPRICGEQTRESDDVGRVNMDSFGTVRAEHLDVALFF